MKSASSTEKAAKRTPWYPPHIKPVRKGLYQATVFIRSPNNTAPYMRWDGLRWTNPYLGGQPCQAQERAWRGLTRKSK